MASVYPEWEDIDRFHNKLTDGERHITEYLHANLSEEWGIYVQPFLNGSRPDIILLSQKHGIIVIEVKDWNLHNFYLKNDTLYLKRNDGHYKKESPLDQARHYSKKLKDLIPNSKSKSDFNLIRKIIYFHCESQSSVDELFPRCWANERLVGTNRLSINELNDFIYRGLNEKNDLLKTETFKHIRTWLQPPFHSKEQGEDIHLKGELEKYAKPKPGSHRIRGVAGSGKTLVVACRAARLAELDKENKILIVSYNKTLVHYIKDMIKRTPFEFYTTQIVCTHFHGLCKDLLNELEYPKPKKNYLKCIVPAIEYALKNASHTGLSTDELKYDAILIDEAQDFKAEWIDLLRKFQKGRKEFLIVCDEAQNIYERNIKWTDNIGIKKGFAGPWGKLPNCIRFPRLIAEEVNRFSTMYLPNVKLHPIPTQTKLSEFNHILRWITCESDDEAKNQIEAAYNYLYSEIGQHPTDIVTLFQCSDMGEEMVKRFENKNIYVNHDFDDIHKESFWMGDARTKMSTIHSFKGFELKNVIVVIEFDNPYLIYTAISRSQENLIVINRVPKYDEYGKEWQNTRSFHVVN